MTPIRYIIVKGENFSFDIRASKHGTYETKEVAYRHLISEMQVAREDLNNSINRAKRMRRSLRKG